MSNKRRRKATTRLWYEILGRYYHHFYYDKGKKEEEWGEKGERGECYNAIHPHQSRIVLRDEGDVMVVVVVVRLGRAGVRIQGALIYSYEVDKHSPSSHREG